MSHFNVSISKFAPSAEWLQTQSRRLVAAWKLEVLFTAVSQNAHAHASEPSAVVEGYIEADICHPSFLVHSVLLLPMCCCAVPCLSYVYLVMCPFCSWISNASSSSLQRSLTLKVHTICLKKNVGQCYHDFICIVTSNISGNTEFVVKKKLLGMFVFERDILTCSR